MLFIQCHINVDATSWHLYIVALTSTQRHDIYSKNIGEYDRYYLRQSVDSNINISITKTSLFKYTEHFNHQKMKNFR